MYSDISSISEGFQEMPKLSLPLLPARFPPAFLMHQQKRFFVNKPQFRKLIGGKADNRRTQHESKGMSCKGLSIICKRDSITWTSTVLKIRFRYRQKPVFHHGQFINKNSAQFLVVLRSITTSRYSTLRYSFLPCQKH